MVDLQAQFVSQRSVPALLQGADYQPVFGLDGVILASPWMRSGRRRLMRSLRRRVVCVGSDDNSGG